MQTNKQNVQRCVGLIGLLTGLVVTTLPAPAQLGVNDRPIRNQQNRNDRNRTNRGTLELPEGVDNVTSIDAINILIAETSDPETGENRQHLPLVVRHVYSGGIARLFGGDSVPTTDFITPAFSEGNNSFGTGYGNNSFGNNGYGNNGYGRSGVVSNGNQFLGGSFGQGFNQGGFPGFNGGNNLGNVGSGNGFNTFNNATYSGTFSGFIPAPNPAANLQTINPGSRSFGASSPLQPGEQIYNGTNQPAP